MDNWTSVYETDQLYLADMIKSVLCDSNIDAVVLNQKDSSYLFGRIRVMVDCNDREKAEEIIKTFERE